MTATNTAAGDVSLTHRRQIYQSLLLPFSTNPSEAESAYRAANLQKTKGTLFITPPSEAILRSTYNAPPRPKTRMSSGAVALCKHFERIPDSPRSKRDQTSGQRHPFWTEPRGGNDNKTYIAAQVLESMLDDACWRNVMLLHRGIAVYEIRNSRGWGMRWTLAIEEIETSETSSTDAPSTNEDLDDSDGEATSVTIMDDNGRQLSHTDNHSHASSGMDIAKRTQGKEEGNLSSESQDEDQNPNRKQWKIINVRFRGFLEPIEGMEHELLK